LAAIGVDRNLLFGLLALQNGLINQGRLVAAFQAWTLAKARDLADHLVGRGDLGAHDRSVVDVLGSDTAPGRWLLAAVPDAKPEGFDADPSELAATMRPRRSAVPRV
jgi:hypothetical protein